MVISASTSEVVRFSASTSEVVRFRIVGKAICAGQICDTCIGILLKAVGRHILVRGTAGLAVVDIRSNCEVRFRKNCMRICTSGDHILAGFQNIAAVRCFDSRGIVGRHIFLGNIKVNALRRAGLEDLSLGEVDQVDCRLLYAAIGIGRSEVKLYHFLAGDKERDLWGSSEVDSHSQQFHKRISTLGGPGAASLIWSEFIRVFRQHHLHCIQNSPAPILMSEKIHKLRG